MNAEALIGKVLGTCTLQKLVGQGGMGAVFLAQQSRPKRQVAVKVLLPMTPLNSNQLAAFLERFRRETDAAASLEHPNIMPVHEYGEQDGIAYLVMPYISGGTLRDELERIGQLPLPKALDYIEQLSIALDFAHEHGVIHRDIKPANIMVTSEGRLLLTDFGLVKIVAEGQKPQVRLTGAGAPVGTPDYMAPEQVIGEEVDTRADLYSLGVILFQMVTGTTPFNGETPMQIAAQHLQIPPPSPQMLRPDLPITAEQVILRAMAKRPADRYMYAQDLAHAFRSALIKAGINVEATSKWAGLMSGTTASRLAIPKGQFEPIRQTASMPKIKKEDIQKHKAQGGLLSRAGAKPTPPKQPEPAPAKANGGLLTRSGMKPAAAAAPVANTAVKPQQGNGLLSKTGKFPMVGAPTGATAIVSPPPPKKPAGGGLLSRAKTGPATDMIQPIKAAPPAPAPKPTRNLQTEQYNAQAQPAWQYEQTALAPMPLAEPNRNTGTLPKHHTGTLTDVDLPRRSNTVTLNDPVKVVKVPVGPGRFITGLLPYTHQPDEDDTQSTTQKPWVKLAIIAAVVLIVLGSLSAFLLTRNPGTTQTNTTTSTQSAQGTKDPRTTEQIQATNTAVANILVEDTLERKIRNWNEGAGSYEFKTGGYYLSNTSKDDTGPIASTILGQSFDTPMVFTLTMQQTKGDVNMSNNTFAMVFNFTSQKKDGKDVQTFYSFEIKNTKEKAAYQLWRYDNSKEDPWEEVKDGKVDISKEFKKGIGKDATNTISIRVNNGEISVTVNGTKLSKTFKDNTLKSGAIGMLVHAPNSQVAFSNLRITRS